MNQVVAHKLVAKVAREAAGELYERLMGDNMLRKAWVDSNPGLSAKQLESRFIEKNSDKCIAFARATLATMLNSALDEKLKLEIVEALALDASIPGRVPRQRAVQIINKEALR